MNILITGANGQLGNEMRVLSKENGQHAYFFTDVQELDICDEQSVHGFVKDNRIDVIANCAAYTAVDSGLSGCRCRSLRCCIDTSVYRLCF